MESLSAHLQCGSEGEPNRHPCGTLDWHDSCEDNNLEAQHLPRELGWEVLQGALEGGDPVDTLGITPVGESLRPPVLARDNYWVRLCEQVSKQGYPNAWNAQVPIPTHINIELLQSLLQGYEDREVIQWVKYGWPISRPPNIDNPGRTWGNHKGATDFPEQMENYLKREIEWNAVQGPFQEIPFKHTERIGLLPLSSWPKKDSPDRRVLMDASWPLGRGVNEGIQSDAYMGFTRKLTFPTVDAVAKQVSQIGKAAHIYKRDGARFFRQLGVDPYDYPLLCFTWKDQVYFDVVISMGLRSGPMCAQRLSSCLRYIHNSMGYFLLNYVDDLMGVEHKYRVQDAFEQLGRTLRDLNIMESESKVVPPSHVVECLGTLIDAQAQTISITNDRLEELRLLLCDWNMKAWYTRKQLESLIGKLQFVTNCVRPGRVFINRLLEVLRRSGEGKLAIQEQIKRDVMWWLRFLPQFNGVGILWMEQHLSPGEVISCDASLRGAGVLCGKLFARKQFPQWLLDRATNIAHLEMITLVASIKLFHQQLRGKRFLVLCDNMAVVTVLNTGAARDEVLLEGMREVAYVSAREQFEMRVRHIGSADNLLPDLLSRWGEGKAIQAKFHSLTKEGGFKQVHMPANLFNFDNDW